MFLGVFPPWLMAWLNVPTSATAQFRHYLLAAFFGFDLLRISSLLLDYYTLFTVLDDHNIFGKKQHAKFHAAGHFHALM